MPKNKNLGLFNTRLAHGAQELTTTVKTVAGNIVTKMQEVKEQAAELTFGYDKIPVLEVEANPQEIHRHTRHEPCSYQACYLDHKPKR